MTINDTINRINKIKQQIQQLNNIKIVVGIPESIAGQTHKSAKKRRVRITSDDVARLTEAGVPGMIRPRKKKRKARVIQRKTEVPLGDVAKWMEYGVPGKIPPRPFLGHSMPKLKEMYNKALKDAIKDIIKGRDIDLNTWAHRIGKKAVNIIRKTIEDSDSWAVPNRPSVYYRKVKEYGNSQPLQETKHLWNSITYDVR